MGERLLTGALVVMLVVQVHVRRPRRRIIIVHAGEGGERRRKTERYLGWQGDKQSEGSQCCWSWEGRRRAGAPRRTRCEVPDTPCDEEGDKAMLRASSGTTCSACRALSLGLVSFKLTSVTSRSLRALVVWKPI